MPEFAEQHNKGIQLTVVKNRFSTIQNKLLLTAADVPTIMLIYLI